MKLSIGYYDVEIKAKRRLSDKANKKDTESFLNMISMCFDRAAEHYKTTGASALEAEATMMSDDIYMFLKSLGVYDN